MTSGISELKGQSLWARTSWGGGGLRLLGQVGWPLPPSSHSHPGDLQLCPSVVAMADSQKPAQLPIWVSVSEVRCLTGTFFLLSSINVSDATSSSNSAKANSNSNYDALGVEYM